MLSGKWYISLKNQSQLQGKLAELCAATFDPSSGTLGPNSRMEVTVSFTSHTDVSHHKTTQPLYLRHLPVDLKSLFFQLELTEVTALCEVQGMNSPLVLHLVAPKPKKLSVAYSLPDIR